MKEKKLKRLAYLKSECQKEMHEAEARGDTQEYEDYSLLVQEIERQEEALEFDD